MDTQKRIESWKLLSQNHYSDQTRRDDVYLKRRSTSSELFSEGEEAAVVAEDRGVRHQLKLLYIMIRLIQFIYINPKV